MDSQVIANLLMDIEQKKHTHLDVNEVSLLSYEQATGILSYRVKISSRMDPRWRLTDSEKKINISELITKIRDDKLKILLED